MLASPLHKGLETGPNGGRRGAREDASLPRRDLVSVCSAALRVGEETSMLCIAETFLGWLGR